MQPRPPSAPIRALIADDEPAARRGVRLLLSRHDDVEVVGECGCAAEIAPALARHGPDVVFLDVRMPGGTGIEAMRGAVDASGPLVVLVSAFEEHALEAFDIEALDYLLKPFTDEAFARSLTRVRRHVRRIRAQASSRRGGEEAGRAERPAGGERLAIRTGERIRLVDPDAVRWVAADGDYVRLHTRDGEYLLRETMQGIEERMGGGPFIRIHRSTLVRADAIREVRPRGRGRYVAVLDDGVRRDISRRGRERLERTFGISL